MDVVRNSWNVLSRIRLYGEKCNVIYNKMEKLSLVLVETSFRRIIETRNSLRRWHKSHWPGTRGRFGRTVSEHCLKKKEKETTQGEEEQLKKKKRCLAWHGSSWESVFHLYRSRPTSSWFLAKPLSSSVKLNPVPTSRGRWIYKRDPHKIFHTHQNVVSQCPGLLPDVLGCRCTRQSIWRSMRSPSNWLHRWTESFKRVVEHAFKCSCSRLVRTSQVLVHHVRSVFHEESEHGGSPRAALQPQQDWGSLSVSLRVRQRREFVEPPGGD